MSSCILLFNKRLYLLVWFFDILIPDIWILFLLIYSLIYLCSVKAFSIGNIFHSPSWIFHSGLFLWPESSLEYDCQEFRVNNSFCWSFHRIHWTDYFLDSSLIEEETRGLVGARGTKRACNSSGYSRCQLYLLLQKYKIMWHISFPTSILEWWNGRLARSDKTEIFGAFLCAMYTLKNISSLNTNRAVLIDHCASVVWN